VEAHFGGNSQWFGEISFEDGVRGGMQYHFQGSFPVSAPLNIKTNRKIPKEIWPIIAEQSKVKTYRELANEYGVSYEAIRRVLNATSLK